MSLLISLLDDDGDTRVDEDLAAAVDAGKKKQHTHTHTHTQNPKRKKKKKKKTSKKQSTYVGISL